MLQTLVILVIVAVAFGFMARRAWRTLRPAVVGGKAGCGDGCGCGSAAGGATGDWAKT